MRRRELALRLRQLRASRDLTVEQVAEQLLCSPTKISRIETGGRPAGLRDVRDLCQLYSVDEAESRELMGLARRAREPGWWQQYDDPGLLGPYLGLEQEASAITYFSMYFIHGLLQTEDYARSIIKGISPQIDPATLADRVAVRMRRQQLTQQPYRPRVVTIMDEAVLRRQVGGPQVMAAQLNKIVKVAEEEWVIVRVIPFNSGSIAAADSNFTLFEFDGSPMPRVVYVESLTSNTYIEGAADVERYSESLDHLRDAALSPQESLALISEIIDAQREAD
jgi:transcriptional regulator with XRE-family HTH domain